MNIAILCHASAGGSGVVATERPFRLTEERLSQLGLSSNLLGDGLSRRVKTLWVG
jgi:hypothetical protein